MIKKVCIIIVITPRNIFPFFIKYIDDTIDIIYIKVYTILRMLVNIFLVNKTFLS